MMRLRQIFLIGVMVVVLSLKSAVAHGEVIAWRASPTDAGAIRTRLKIDARDIDLDLRVTKSLSQQHGATILVETGKSDAFNPVAAQRTITIAKIDLSHLPESVRGPALRDLIGKLKEEHHATHVVAHGDAASSATLSANAALFDGLLLENTRAPTLLKTQRAIILIDAEGLATLNPDARNEKSASANQRWFYLAATALAPPLVDPSCKTTTNHLSADPARRALVVALDDWLRGAPPPGSRFPGAGDLAPARTLNWPKIPNLPPPPDDDRPMVKIDVDGNETSGLRMPDQALPIATFVNFNSLRDKSGKPCGGGDTLPFPSTQAIRAANHDPRLSLVERYGSRAYYVATLRVIADTLVRQRLLLPQDADAYVAAGKTAPF